jgi:hypothetical protein
MTIIWAAQGTTPAPARRAEAPVQAPTRGELNQQIRDQIRDATRQATREAVQAAQEAARATRAAPQISLDGRPVIVPPSGGGFGQAFPGMPPTGGPFDMIPPEAVTISIAFFAACAVIAIGLPLARAFARRMDRNGAVARRMDRKGMLSPADSPDLANRLERIEQAVDAIALEVERISEGQRFSTKVLSDLRALPQPNPLDADPLRVREAVRVER